MKKLLWVMTCFVFLIAGFSMYKITQYKAQIDNLKVDKVELTNKISQMETQTAYLLNNNPTKLDSSNFESWSNYFETAEIMVKDSGGNFLRPWATFLVKEAEKYDIDPFLVYELLKVESGATFNPTLIGPKTRYGHAHGLAQFMKNTAPWVADMAKLPYEDELLYDPYYSIKLSLVYLDYLYDQYQNWDETLTAYHRGMTGMKRYKLKNGHAKSEYALMIQTNAEKHDLLAIAK
ncbi:lytic transglycosylase domain-containing protein [Gracilibacillus ureilyticus]|uniref:lytic transglycosylase domain-containing protein n=1 Tax=Gracilibacillus ureilyticus TaxID=531814 RepID=UPI001FE22B1B|nr:transglycosylase SLT domain-containing protein [Gracilibacillus ureilyticus]